MDTTKISEIVKATKTYLSGHVEGGHDGENWHNAYRYVNSEAVKAGLAEFFTACGIEDADERAAEFNKKIFRANLSYWHHVHHGYAADLAGMVLEFTRQVAERAGK